MIKKTKMEAEAIEFAGGRAGAFIEEAMKMGNGSDMANWTPEIWAAFVDTTCTGFVERMQELKSIDDEVPF